MRHYAKYTFTSQLSDNKNSKDVDNRQIPKIEQSLQHFMYMLRFTNWKSFGSVKAVKL